MQLLFRVGLVPVLLLVLTGLYWFHIADAPAVAQRVPTVVVGLVAFLAIVVLVGDLASELKNADRKASGAVLDDVKSWMKEWRLQLIFVALCALYFVVFSSLGFNVANVVFLSVAFPVAGFARDCSLAVRGAKTVSTVILVSVIVYALAHVMDFNVPRGPLGF